MTTVLALIIASIFLIIGILSVAVPGAVRQFVAKDHGKALKVRGKSDEDTEIWLKKNLAREWFFRFFGFVEIAAAVFGIYAILKSTHWI